MLRRSRSDLLSGSVASGPKCLLLLSFPLQCLYGCYVHSSIIPTFHRRCYWLLQVRAPSSPPPLRLSTRFLSPSDSAADRLEL